MAQNRRKATHRWPERARAANNDSEFATPISRAAGSAECLGIGGLSVGPFIRKDESVRILVVSDLHYRLPHYDWLVEAAADVDVVAIAGDLADVVSPVPHEVQTVVLAKYLGLLAERTDGARRLRQPRPRRARAARRAGRRLAAAARRTARSTSTAPSVDIDDTRFTVCPWWDGPVTREEVGAQLAAAAVDRPARWVWLYHAPPAGTAALPRRASGVPRPRPRRLDRASTEPDIVLCGHIHQAPWVDGGSWHARLGETWVFNAGKQIGHGAAAHHPRHRRRDGGLVRRLRVGDGQPRLTAPAGRLLRRGRPRGRAPSRSRGARPWWCTRVSRIWSTIPRWPPASANCCFTSTR